MQRWIVGIFILIIVLDVAVMQTPIQKEEGYTIIFDDMPKLHNDQINYMNQEIGKIISKAVGTSGVVKMVVGLDDAFIKTMRDNIAFFPDHGQLNVARLQTVGSDLPEDAIFCGFSSKAKLNWFKFKTILNSRTSAASRRALNLYRKSGLS